MVYISTARVYAEVNDDKSDEYLDYESLIIVSSNEAKYRHVSVIDQGTHRNVLKATNTEDETVVFKMLKPVEFFLDSKINKNTEKPSRRPEHHQYD